MLTVNVSTVYSRLITFSLVFVPCGSLSSGSAHLDPEASQKGPADVRGRGGHARQRHQIQRRGRRRTRHASVRHERPAKPLRLPRGQELRLGPGPSLRPPVDPEQGERRRRARRLLALQRIHTQEGGAGGRGPVGAALRLLPDLRFRGHQLAGPLAQLHPHAVHHLRTGLLLSQ